LSANEDAYLLSGHDTFQSRYESVKSVIEQNRKRYEFNDRIVWDEVQRTAKELAEADELLRQTGAYSSFEEPKAHDIEEEKYDFGQDLGISGTTSTVSKSSIPNMLMTDSHFREEARRLTLDQLRYLYHIMQQYRYGAGKPFYKFLTGGAGTKKDGHLTGYC
jgi:hypothetical protein